MNEIYLKNIEYLKHYNSDIIHFLKGTDVNKLIPIKTKTGKITLEYEGILVHSKYDPDRDGEKFAFSSNVQNQDTVILYGFGLGYHIYPLIDIIGDQGKLYIIEPNKEILMFAFLNIDLTHIFYKPNVRIITGWTEEDLSYFIDYEIFAKLDERYRLCQKVLIYEPSLKSTPNGFDKIKNFFEIMILDKQTSAVFNKIDKDNFKKNLDTVILSAGVKNVLSCIKDKPCIIVGAGPSLDDVIYYLKKYQDNMFIFVIDTALSILLKFGIRPDFVVSVDPQEDSFEHFENCLDANVPLIMIPTSNAKVVSKYKGLKIITFLKGHSLTKKIEKKFEHKGFSLGGGCASGVILNLIIKYGAEPILFAGHDFSFPCVQYYSSYTKRVNDKWMKDVNKFDSIEMKHFISITDPEKKIVYVKDKFGLDIPTHQNLYGYLKTIEQIIDDTVGVRFYNLFTKGAYIKGVQDIIFTEELESILSKKIDKKIYIKNDESSVLFDKESILKEVFDE